MITHNGKQVTLAMRNRKAINLIARNGKAMFGEYGDIAYTAIDAAAKAVILAEYGSVVWSDVKQYAKAHPAIVEFINQDPHLAASISTNSNKERWLVFGGVGYIDTGYYPKSLHTRYEVGFVKLANNGNWRPIINNENDIRFGIVCSSSSANMGKVWCGGMASGAYANADFACNLNTYYDIVFDKNGVVSNGVTTKLSGTIQDAVAQYPACINARYLSATSTSQERSNFKLKYLRILEDDIVQRFFIPYNDNGEAVLLDAENGVIYRNAESGQFTIAVTDKAV